MPHVRLNVVIGGVAAVALVTAVLFSQGVLPHAGMFAAVVCASGPCTTAAATLTAVRTFTSGVNQTYTTPPNTAYLVVELWGGGGGGGGANTKGTRGTGGAGGAYAMKFISNPAATYTYTVGAGGSGGVASDNPTSGTPGGNTSFGGVFAGGGNAGSASQGVAMGGSAGGSAGGGDVNISGGDAQTLNQTYFVGYGGDSPRGGGGCKTNVGGAGGMPGGGGCAGNHDTAGALGGSGGSGMIVVYEYSIAGSSGSATTTIITTPTTTQSTNTGYSNYVHVTGSASTINVECGVFYDLNTVTAGAITANLPPASSCPAGSVITLKKTLLPPHGGFVTAKASSGDTIEGGQSKLFTEKNGTVIRLVGDGSKAWSLDDNYQTYSGTEIVDHHSITRYKGANSPAQPWKADLSFMGGEIFLADPAAGGGGQIGMEATLVGATKGYSPMSWWIGSAASVGNSPYGACFQFAGSLNQGSTPVCLDSYGDMAQMYTDQDEGEIKILSQYRAHASELQQLKCSTGPNYFAQPASSATLYLVPYGKGAGIALPTTASAGVHAWLPRNLPDGISVDLGGVYYANNALPNYNYDVYVWAIPYGAATVSGTYAGEPRLVFGPKYTTSQVLGNTMLDGVFVNGSGFGSVSAQAARYVCTIHVNADGHLSPSGIVNQ